MTTTEPNPVFTKILAKAEDKNRMSAGMRALSERSGEFGDELSWKLAGLALVPDGREMLENALDDYFASSANPSLSASGRRCPVVIGAGYTAAVFAAARAAAGKSKPIVLEKSSRVGGAFAVSRNPSFWLNSPNRGGKMSAAGENGMLNYIPGGVVQPAMLSNGQYSTNADMALAIRITLAQYADVFVNTDVYELDTYDPYVFYRDSSGRNSLSASAVIDARGLGSPSYEGNVEGVTTFPELMARADTMFPLKGIERVAVAGDGDSGKCAVEFLLGIGPDQPMSPVFLDQVEKIDWYGLSLPKTCQEWRETQRGRYMGISRYLPRSQNSRDRNTSRLTTFDTQADTPVAVPGGVFLNGKTYDMVVMCTGNTLSGVSAVSNRDMQVRSYGRSYRNIYRVGPAADLSFTREEIDSGVSDIGANKVAMFRYAPRTAALAAMLD